MPFLSARSLPCLAAGAVAAVVGAAPATAQDYYAGRTIEFIVGGDSGGGYDIYARAVARHLGASHPRQSEHRGQEHARRRLDARRHLHLDRRAQGRRQRRRADAGRHRRPAARRQADDAVRSDQGDLYRHRRHRRAGLRHLPEFQDQQLRRRAEEQDHPRRQLRRRRHPRLRLSAQSHRRHQVRRRHRLQGHGRHRAGDGARRGRRAVRLGLVEREVAERRVGQGQEAQHPGAGRPRPAAGADRHGRADDLDLRQERERPPRRRAGRQPAGVPALLHRAAGHAGGAGQDPAHGIRRDR